MNFTRKLLQLMLISAASLCLIGCAAHGHMPVAMQAMPTAAVNDADPDDESDADAWQTISGILKRQGTLNDGVYTIVVPRDDLYVTVDEMYVPTEAGIESQFHFYHCSCGKTSVVGEFVLLDYEANDVIDVLRTKVFTVASLAPFLLNAHPNVVSIHFQGEGTSDQVAQVIKDALSFTGKERDAPTTNIAPKNQ